MTTSKEFDDALNTSDVVKAEIDKSIEPVSNRIHRVKPNEAEALIAGEKLILGGLPMLNTRTRMIEIEGQEIPSNALKHLYISLSTNKVIWDKQLTIDVVTSIAERYSFDPVAVFLHNLSKPHIEPLEDQFWNNLDMFLFGIDDLITRTFMKRYLVAAVKRPCEPACEYRQVPVLIGEQWIGKSKLGKILFGGYYGSGIKKGFGVDDVTKLERMWCCELAELDGLTKTADIQAFNDFVSRTHDYDRRKYRSDTEAIPRRNVFWGTSNNPPLNDKSGSTRFVCIPLPPVDLPLERVEKAFEAIWARAYLEYRKGYRCYSTKEEMIGILERNSNYSILDPWYESLETFTENKLNIIYYRELYELLDLDISRRKNLDSIRIRGIMANLGWKYDKRRIEGEQIRAFFPINKPTEASESAE